MKKPTIVINMNESLAGIIYSGILIASAYGFFSALGNEEWSTGKLISNSLGLLVSFIGLYTIFSSRFSYVSRESKSKAHGEPKITVTDKEIICNFPSRFVKNKVEWDKINRIQIVTTDEGPEVCDVFYMIQDSDGGGVCIPQDREESEVITNRILNLPGFDYETFTRAMGSTENKWFDVWEKK